MTTSSRTVGLLQRRTGLSIWFVSVIALAICLVWAASPTAAQTAGEGSLQGTVTDSSGAVIPNAAVTATNVATGIATTRNSSSAGFYVISPVHPGTYTVKISAPGFKTVEQSNVVVNALQTRVYDPQLSVGQETQTVEVTAAPPVLD
ncbi:MAG: carboxypeptidase-like regulatory domain-containing protein, partial [Rouxiella aceris]|uniref:carboxypeptidase-like regulatory domain-containing protein n=1 Tax=Rouxiella aceris TaxID=2703884 RepID=UPI0028430D20